MATESNPNAIADFDIDEVIDWDKHDIPSKDIEFDPLQSLNLAANVASTSQKSTTTSAGRGGLVLTNQLLASQPTAGSVHHGETGAAIVGMPQVSQTSAINPVFPGDTSSLIADIRQEYLHAQNSAARSRTPPTPTFPSENFDLPPITPPGSLQAQSGYSVGQQPLRMALVSNLNRPAAVPQGLQTFVQPNLSQLGPMVGEAMEEGSNIENLLDEIVERNMPQGVSEPIVFTPQVSQQPNPSTPRMQMSSQAMQKGIPSVPVRAGSPAHLSVAQTNASGKTSLSIGAVQTGSPLNTVTSSAGPLTPSRSPSPKIKQTVHTGKVSVPLRPGNQPLRLSSPTIQPGSPLQSMGSAPQSPVKTTRTVVAQGNQVASPSQMLQMAVPSAIVSSSPSVKTQVSSNSLQIKQSGGMQSINSQVSMVPLSTSTVQGNLSSMGPQRPLVNVGSQKTSVCTVNNSQGSPITIPSNSHGKPIQGIPLQNLTANPKLLDQLVRSAMGQSNMKQSQLGEATSGASAVQAGQPLICYVVPQNSVSGVQAKGSIPFTATGQPVKMILVNANSALKPPVSSNVPSTKTALTNPASSDLSKVSTSLPVQSFAMGREFGPVSSSPAGDLGSSFRSDNVISVTMSQHSATSSVVTSLAQPSPSHSRIIQSDVCSPAFNASQQNPVRSSVASSANNSVSKLNSILVGSTSVTGESNTLPGLQKPLSSTDTPTSVVQITFVNEATAISQVVAASPCLTSTGQPGAMSASPVILPPENQTLALSQPGTSSVPQDSDEDEDDSTPLSQVAENLKKSDDVKKKKKKKKEKGTKRKKRGRDNLEPSKPLTAYEIFFKETQAAIRLQNQSVEFEDISKIADQMWKNATESQKKVYQEKQEKVQKDYYKALEEYKTKKSLQEDAPSPKHSRVELPETAGSTVVPVSTTPCTATSVPWEAGKDPALLASKPLNHVGQSALSGKPVATVPPMATVKTPATNIHSTAPVKPKKHKVIVNPISQRICLSDGCNMPARTTKERGTQYCSNECVVKHCRAAFTCWVAQRNVKSEIS